MVNSERAAPQPKTLRINSKGSLSDPSPTLKSEQDSQPAMQILAASSEEPFASVRITNQRGLGFLGYLAL